jgi:hypothetical protein
MSEKKTYRVTGSTTYAGYPPGSTFEAELDEGAERRALARGSIKVVVKRAKPKEKSE